MLAVLPHRVGSEAVEEEEVWFGAVWRFRDPAVHGGRCDGVAVGEVGDDGAETGVRE